MVITDAVMTTKMAALEGCSESEWGRRVSAASSAASKQRGDVSRRMGERKWELTNFLPCVP